MSLVVGFVDGDNVWMGADTAGMNSSGEWGEYKNAKIFRWENGFLVGVVGDWHTGSLLQYVFEPPERRPHLDPLAYMCADFSLALKKFYMEYGVAKEGEDGLREGNPMLVGYAGRLFLVQSDFSVLEPVRGYEALGAGAGEARGVLWLTQDMEIEPRERALLALQGAAAHNVMLQQPFVVEVLEPEGISQKFPAPAN